MALNTMYSHRVPSSVVSYSPIGSIEHNLASLLKYAGKLPEIDIHNDNDAIWSLSAHFKQMNHLVIPRFNTNLADTRIAQILYQYKKKRLPSLWWLSSLAKPHDLEIRLIKHGLKKSGSLIGMSHDLTGISERHQNHDLEIHIIHDFSIFLNYEHPYFGESTSKSLNEQILARRQLSHIEPKKFWHFIAYSNKQEPIGSATLFVDSGIAGIYDVGVIRKARRSGVGSAIISATLSFAKRLSCNVAILQTAQESQKFFNNLGFLKINQYNLFSSKILEH